ncbi:MAG: pirin family protein [Nocardioides sp.]|uniref:pirin family protein n=1 Tax=Nocardioides sp. TaxID=35761 RepID=UPI003EFFC9A2
MSNPESTPEEMDLVCGDRDVAVEVVQPREVPLGGPRAMLVRRTLPLRGRSLIGAWCFIDHYGPDRVADTGGMKVAPHPHTGLQTLSWLFAGEIQHRDSAGNQAMVLPGEVNLMTAGHGISHSEVSTAGTDVLHGVQLWVALPDASRDVEPGFEHHVPEPVRGPGWEARVLVGSLLGSTSPVRTFTPLVGAEVMLAGGATLDVPLDPAHEHGLLLDVGSLEVDGAEVKPGELAYVAPGTRTVRLHAREESRLMVLGGEPFGEAIVMWWNFIGRSHDEIVEFRAEWQEQVTADGSVVAGAQSVAPGRFGVVAGEELAPLPAPVLPNVRLRERR